MQFLRNAQVNDQTNSLSSGAVSPNGDVLLMSSLYSPAAGHANPFCTSPAARSRSSRHVSAHASDADLLCAAVEWLDQQSAVCEPRDAEALHKWGSLILGVLDGRVSNSLLRGDGATPVAIDAQMARFADIRWMVTERGTFLVWLGYMRAARIDKSFEFLETVGELYTLPTSVKPEALRPLGTGWKVGTSL